MKNNKVNNKGIVFEVSMIVITIILFTTLFVLVLNKSNDFSFKFGESQMDLFRVYTNQEFHLFNHDQKAKYSAYEVYIDLAKKGFGSKCGEKEGYPIWYENNISCFPTQTEIELNFKEIFNKKMKGNYSLFFYNEYIIGYPDFELIWGINNPGESVKGRLWGIHTRHIAQTNAGKATITPNFKAYIGYNKDNINKIISMAQSLKTKNDLKKLPSNWQITEKNDYALIEVSEDTKFSLYPKITTRFAIQLSKN